MGSERGFDSTRPKLLQNCYSFGDREMGRMGAIAGRSFTRRVSKSWRTRVKFTTKVMKS
jgi:hypothetical protein